MLIIYILLFIILFTILYSLYKIRNIHLMTYNIKDIIENQSIEFTNLFRQIQAFEALQKKLNLNEPLPPLRAWAASPDFLLVITEHIQSTSSKIIMECSSGASTIVLARCIQMQNNGHIYSLEHDLYYANKTKNELKKHQLEDWVTILHAPLVDIGNGQKWYDIKDIPDIPFIDLLVIDGPPGYICERSRYPAIKQLKNKIKNTTIFLDDSNRPQEKEIIQLWKKENDIKCYTEYECEKGCISFKIID